VGVSLVRVPLERLSATALEGLVEEFVTREGTEYGARDYTLDEKKAAVFRQLDRGEVCIVFDPASESCALVMRDQLPTDDTP